MTYTCPDCGKECSAKPEDQGIGPGEFWGVPFVDKNMALVSSCCGATLEESYSEWKQNEDDLRADHEYDERRERELLRSEFEGSDTDDKDWGE